MIVNQKAPESEQMPWDSRRPPPPNNVHRGQIKLLGCEIAALVVAIKESLEKVTIVYAGAAAGQHIPALAHLFPDMHMHLYDPHPFSFKPTEFLHIYQQLFTEDTAHEWATFQHNFGYVFFITDVRTSGDTKEEHESEILENMRMQANWVEIIKPHWFSFKFRIPYTVIERGEKYPYFSGQLFYQPFPKPVSMEMRLIGDHKDVARGSLYHLYDSPALERILSYHNVVVRPDLHRYLNAISGDATPYTPEYGFDNGYDCSYYLYAVKSYVEALESRNLVGRGSTWRPPISRFSRNLRKSIREDQEERTAEEEVNDYIEDLAATLVEITSHGLWTLKTKKPPTRR